MGVATTVNEFLLSKLLDEAQYYTDHKMWLHAAQVYHRILDEQGGPQEVSVRLANVYAAMGNLAAAERTLLNALGRDEGNAGALYALAMLFYNSQDFERSRYYLERLVPQRMPHVHFLLGSIHAMREDWIHAQRHYELARELDPSSTDAFSRLIEVLLRSGQAPKAVDMLRERLAEHPDDWKSAYLLGLAHSVSGQWVDALACLSGVLATRPDDVDVLCATAESLIGLNQHARARETLLHGLDIEPDSVRVIALLARVAVREGDRKRAMHLYRRVLDLDASNLDALDGMRYLGPGRNEDTDD